MKRILFSLLFGALCLRTASAYPPALHHTLFGMVRDQYGIPLQVDNATLIVETASGITNSVLIHPSLAPGVNYRLNLPMDAGLTSDLYQPTALRPSVAFKIKVKIGNVTYLPMEMVADFAHLGLPGKETRINLTLGEDLDGDGLPDAWERSLLSRLGGNRTIADIRPNDDSDNDGMSNIDEYVAGTYAFDPKNGFSLKIVGFSGPAPLLEFTSLTGRYYTVLGSADLTQWSPVEFRIAGSESTEPFIEGYDSREVQPMRVEIKVDATTQGYKFFKLMVQ
jgi:hypothetical protein